MSRADNPNSVYLMKERDSERESTVRDVTQLILWVFFFNNSKVSRMFFVCMDTWLAPPLTLPFDFSNTQPMALFTGLCTLPSLSPGCHSFPLSTQNNLGLLSAAPKTEESLAKARGCRLDIH